MVYVNGERAGKVIIQLAPTGMVPTKKDNPHIPVTPEEIARDTQKAYKLGASVVHVHARDEKGRPTYRKEVYADIISRIRDRCPGIIVCASTSGRNDPDIRHRAEVLELGPEMASLTVGTVNFQENPSINPQEAVQALAKAMYDRGIKPEIEVFEPGFINTAKYLAKKGRIKEPLHFNILAGSLGSVPADMRDIVYMVDSLPQGSTWSATGIGRFRLQGIAAALLMGGHVRVGLEDSVYYDHDEKSLATNPGLVRKVAAMAGSLGREIATPAEARHILGLSEARRGL
jgi:3-keto-5-aminohexanoate cleavage enzyme